MKTFVDGLYKLTDYQFYLFSINCKLQIAIFTVFTVKTKNFGHLYTPHLTTAYITSSNTPNLIIPAWPGQRNNPGPSYLLANKIKISGLRQIELLESTVELT